MPGVLTIINHTGKVSTKTVRHIRKAQRAGDGVSLVRVGYVRISLPSCSCRKIRFFRIE